MTTIDDRWYRVHWDDCPEFSADNAWSCLWGLPRSADGSPSECTACGGDGVDLIEGGTCGVCGVAGIDSELLVVPDAAIIKTMTWRDFVRRQVVA